MATSGTTKSPAASSNGHRRVKSLVREFDEVGTTVPASPVTPPISPTSPSTRGAHVRRSSLSYSSASPLASPTFTFTTPTGQSSSTSPMLKGSAANGNAFNGGVPAGSHRRKGSVHVSPITVVQPSGLGLAEGTALDGVHEEMLGETAEEEDVFLPMSPNPSSPFKINGGGSSSPLTPGFNGGAQSHARKHSRIHERNLSAFFPRPGAGSPAVGYGDTYEDPNGSGRHGGVSDVPSAGSSPGYGANGDSGLDSGKSKAGRRGHHHRHSLSHNFFSFLDPTEQHGGNESVPFTPTKESLVTRNNYGLHSPMTPQSSSMSSPIPAGSNSNFLPMSSHSLRSKYSHLPYPIRIVLFAIIYLPLTTQLALTLSFAQIVIGAMLWITGQSGESLAVTGLGYLVVFDGVGGLSGVLVEGGAGIDAVWNLLSEAKGDQGVRLPFGTRRLTTLSHFSQAIYLLFSAVYVCKESVEHVLLMHGANEHEGGHGAGHSGMGHGDGGGGTSSNYSPGIMLPVLLLALAAISSLISSIALRNHQTLADAVGPSGLSFGRTRRSGPPTVVDLVGNPFTLTVLVFSVGLVLSALTIPRAQLGPLDKVVALLQSIAMFYIAYPAAIATGQVLLQTSPPPLAFGQMNALTSALRDIENHPMVVSLSQPHIWQLTPSPHARPSTSSPTYRRGPPTSPEGSTLIVTLTIHVKHDAGDDQLLSVTSFAKERCEGALRSGGGELTVEVKRGRTGEVKFYGESPMDSNASHGHGHGHEHGGGGHGHHH